MPGRLYLIPVPLDFGCATQVPIAQVLPAQTLQTAAQLTHWICENAKSARAVLKRIAQVRPLACPLQEMHMVQMPYAAHKHGDHLRAPAGQATSADECESPPWQALDQLLWKALAEGIDVGLMSEAGMPAIADPGASVVRRAHALGIEVVPLVGPMSLMLALAASGANGQRFAFHGYLPIQRAERIQRLLALEQEARLQGQAQIVIETPYRNAALLADCLSALKPTTHLSVSVSLTLPSARTKSMPIAQWRQFDAARCFFGPDTSASGKEPAVFVMG